MVPTAKNWTSSRHVNRSSRSLRASMLVAGLFSIATLSTISAQAKTFGQWNFDEVGNYCIASTAAKVGTETMRLEISLEKSNRFPVEVLVRPTTSPSIFQALTAVTSTKMNFAFGKLIDRNNQETFWQIPRATDQLIDQMRNGKSFQVRALAPAATPSLIEFSLSGSATALDTMETRCSKGKPLFDRNFEKQFLPSNVDRISADKIQPSHTEALRAAHIKAYQAYVMQQSLKDQRAKLDVKYAKEIKEQKTIEGSLDQLRNKDLRGLQDKRDYTDAQAQAAASDVTQKNSEVALAQKELAAAQSDLNSANKAIAPLEPEFRRQLQALQLAQSKLRSVDDRLGDISARANRLQVELSDFRSQMAQLQIEVSRLQSELNQAQVDRANAQSIYDRYDESIEVQQRLQSDLGYQGALRNQQQANSDVAQATTDVQRLKLNEQQALADLKTCQKTVGAKCVNENNTYKGAVFARQQAENQKAKYERNRQTFANQLRQIDQKIRSEVHRRKLALLSDVQHQDLLITQIQGRIRGTNDRMRQIAQVEIPKRETEYTRLHADEAKLKAQQPALEAEVQQKTTNFENYKRSVDWDGKQAAVSAAQTEYNKRDNRLLQRQSEKKTLDDKWATFKKQLAEIDLKIAKTNSEIQKLETRRTQVEASLAAYSATKAKLESDLQNASEAFKDAKQDFSQNIV